MKYIDLTHTITDNMPVFPGDMPVELKPIVTYEKDGVANHSLFANMHIGTHIDTPGHFTEIDKKITDYPVDRFFGNAVCIDARNRKMIEKDILATKTIKKDDIVVFYTGLDSQFYESTYFDDHPVITPSCAWALVDLGVKMVGVDFPSVDKAPYQVHKILLANDILIIENLTNLNLLIDKTFKLIALPLKVDAHGAPARVVGCLI